MGDERTARPRVGHIQFLNCLPIYWGLMRSGALIDVDLHKDSPDRLSAALVAGDLDIGPISLVEYLRHADELLLLPDIAVGSDGPVLSVNIVSTRPLEELDGAKVALGSTSRTGVLLAQLLLGRAVRRTAGVLPLPAGPDPDAAGGRRRRCSSATWRCAPCYEAPERGLTVTDLGAAWREWTGLPMVFAVWAVRRDFAAAHPGLVKEVHEAFLRSRDLCLSELDRSPRRPPAGSPSTRRRWRTTSGRWTSPSGERQVAGLREFARRAAELGEAPALPRTARSSSPAERSGCAAVAAVREPDPSLSSRA